MAFLSSNSSTHSYQVSYRTVQLSLKDALAKAVAGSMSPMDVFKQLPANLAKSIDSFSRATHGDTFRGLQVDEQRTVLTALLDEINGTRKKTTLKQALERSSRGLLPPAEVYEQIPKELKTRLNGRCREMHSREFLRLDVRQQKEMLKRLLVDAERARPRAVTPAEAFRAVVRREIAPDTVYRQLPPELTSAMNGFANTRHSKGYEQLDLAEKIEVFEALSNAIALNQ